MDEARLDADCRRRDARRNWIAGADFQERRLVGGRTVLDVDADAASAAAAADVDARRRDEIAPPPGGTRCRDDELSREKYANPIGPDPQSFVRKAVYRNEYFSIPRPRLDSRTRRFRARFRTRPRPRLYDPVN